MAENDLAGATKAPAKRPTIILPPRSSYFAVSGHNSSAVSPGPLTLLSSFFADDSPELDCHSFTQMLVGPMSSPEVTSGSEVGVGRSATSVKLPEQFLISPGGFIDSPGNFSISHQEALAQVTAQAAHSSYQTLTQLDASMVQQKDHEAPYDEENDKALESAERTQLDQQAQPTAAVIVDKPADDGYNWRKYGQKMVKDSEFPRSYYKCTHPSCSVKKKVARSVDGQITEIIYKGQHTHPTLNKRIGKEGLHFQNGSNEIDENAENFGRPQELSSTANHGFFNREGDLNYGHNSVGKRDCKYGHGTSEQMSESSDSEEVSEVQTDDGVYTENGPKRRNVSVSTQKILTEPRIVVQTTSEVDLLDDGYRWRKYGQKVVKGNPNPRSYYKCTFAGCGVRKHIERCSTDLKAVITTYEGKHNHDLPASRNSSYKTVIASSISSRGPTNQGRYRSTNFRSNEQRPVTLLQFKEEHEIS